MDLTKDNICSVRYSFPTKNFRGISESAKDLVGKMLVKDKRSDNPGASQTISAITFPIFLETVAGKSWHKTLWLIKINRANTW